MGWSGSISVGLSQISRFRIRVGIEGYGRGVGEDRAQITSSEATTQWSEIDQGDYPFKGRDIAEAIAMCLVDK